MQGPSVDIITNGDWLIYGGLVLLACMAVVSTRARRWLRGSSNRRPA
jgi:hypothetical protein